MAQVSIVMGSDSDMPVMAKAAEILDKFGISYEMRIISAHRMPDTFLNMHRPRRSGRKGDYRRRRYGSSSAGYVRCIVSDAGDRYPDAHDVSGGRDSLYSIVQMPSGIPVATVAINGGANAGILAAKIFSGFDPELAKLKGLQRRDERRRTEKGCKAAGMRLSQLHKINRCTGTVWRIRWITRVLEWILKPDTNRWN